MSRIPAHVDIAIVGAGASGLTAAIWAGHFTHRHGKRVAVFEGARRPGAKILVSGGGRCNVTNAHVTPADYHASSPAVVRNVLRAFDVAQTLQWFRSLGVELALEEDGKYFPRTQKASTVLEALLREVQRRGCSLVTGARVHAIDPLSEGFVLRIGADRDSVFARRVILATGGLALPRSGSDGQGLEWLRALGHTIIDPVPALVPLRLKAQETPAGRFAELAGASVRVRLRYHSRSEDRDVETVGPLLWTHFGVSGPAVLDISRFVARDLRTFGPPAIINLALEPFASLADAMRWLLEARSRFPARTVANAIRELVPARLADLLAGPLQEKRMGHLTREDMQSLSLALAELPLEVIGDRGFSFAEVTAGGVDLREVNWRTMESRLVPGLHLCGELLDVDGRLGGFNFQWAWSSGYVAGRAAATAVCSST